MVTVADLIRYRLEHEKLVKLVAKAELPTDYGPFDVHVFENTVSGQAHIALTIGDLTSDEPTLVREPESARPTSGRQWSERYEPDR